MQSEPSEESTDAGPTRRGGLAGGWRRWQWLILITAAVVVALATTALMVTLGTAPDDSPAPAGATDQTEISVKVTTDNGRIGQNHDDRACVFRELQYVLRDQENTIVASGRIETDGVSAGGADWASVGEIESRDPYRCTTTWTITAPDADHYQLLVTASQALGGSRDVEVVFGRADADLVEVAIG